MERQKEHLCHLLLLVLAGTFAATLMLWITAYGPGVSPDSTIYIETAKSLLGGNGFFARGKPMTHYPPAYPLLLAVAALFQHGDVLQGSRLLHAFLFGTNVVLIGLAVKMCTERSLLATCCAMLLFLSSATMVSVHSMAWSEPPFITFSLLAFVLLSKHVVRPTLYLLLAASISFGLAIATRYIGIALLPPMVFALLLFGNRPMRHKIRDTFIATTIGILPLITWLIRNIITTQNATNRTFAIHPFGSHHATELIITMYDFVLPISISSWTKSVHFGVASALFMAALATLHRKNYIRHNTDSAHIVFPSLCVIFFLTYVVLLAISISFFDALTPLDARTLLPAFLVLTVAVISLAWSLSHALEERGIWWSFIFFVLLSISINGERAVLEIIHVHMNGHGYTSRYWRNSETISHLTTVRDVRKIYSYGPDVIRFWTGREALLVPPKIFADTLRANEDYEKQLKLMCGECRGSEAIIVYLNGITGQRYLPTLKELESKCNMPVLMRFSDGLIYGR